MKVAELLIKCLENEGVKVMFGLPGEENLDVMDALHDSDIRFIQTRHEQGAAFMADVHGRLTREAGVCLATLGPGATNLITGVADAYLDRAPMVVLTGQADLSRLHKESHQHIDLVEMFRPITKWNTQILSPPIVSEVMRKAFKMAQVEKPGPTHLDLPEDVARMETNQAPLPVNRPRGGLPAEREIERALEVIKNSNFPIVIAGNGVLRGQASEALTHFAEAFQIPVVNTFMGKGAISYKNPLYINTVGLQAEDPLYCGLERSDLIVAVGYDLVEYAPRFWNPDSNKKIIHIDTQPAEVDAYYNVQVGLIGGIQGSLKRLIARAYPRKKPNLPEIRDMIMGQLQAFRDDRSFPLKPQKIIADMRHVMGDDDIVIADVGAHKLWVARMYPCDLPNTCIISNGLAAMGIALPGAIAAKLHFPEKKVLAVMGDGGFMMNSQELETAIRAGTPFVTLIFRDGHYGVIRWKQLARFNRASYADFQNPDFVKYAESFGAKGYRVEAANELVPIFKEAFEQKVPSVIDCPVDYSENTHLAEKLGDLICPL
ncbi:MAG: acetolactate synthase large subunit [Desulfobacteria bacterium]